jgi:AcrR family transcriptional regulator
MSIIVHPTKNKLVETAAEFLKVKDPSAISVDEVLEASGISKGSLYHHFEDFGELLEIAQIRRYADWVDKSIETLLSVLTGVKTREGIVSGIKLVTRATQSPEVQTARMQRARTIGNSMKNERFRIALGIEQERLTSALEDMFREAIERGWYRSELNPRTCAVLIQAYTIGRVVDDVVDNPIDAESWYDLIDELVERLFLK